MVNIKFVKLDDNAHEPDFATIESAGSDLYPARRTPIRQGRQAIPLGLAVEIPQGHSIHIQPKSGQSLFGLKAVYVTPEGKEYDALIDADVLISVVGSDDRGEICVIVRVHQMLPPSVRAYVDPKNAIAQAVHHAVEPLRYIKVDKLSETERGKRGFGKVDADKAKKQCPTEN